MSLIRCFFNRSSLCSAVSESRRALSLSRLRWGLFSLSHPLLIWRLAERRHVALSQNSYCELHDYKSKTNTETVWQYKTFRAVYRLPLAVTEALHTSCDQPWRTGDGRTIIVLMIIIIYEISQLYRLCGARSGSLASSPGHSQILSHSSSAVAKRPTTCL